MNNPEVSTDALLETGTTVCGLTISPFTMGKVLVLEKINHPFVASGKSKAKSLSNTEVAELVLVLTSEPSKLLAILQEGREVFDQEVFACAEKIPLGDVAKVGEVIAKHFEQATSTLVTTGEKKSS